MQYMRALQRAKLKTFRRVGYLRGPVSVSKSIQLKTTDYTPIYLHVVSRLVFRACLYSSSAPGGASAYAGYNMCATVWNNSKRNTRTPVSGPCEASLGPGVGPGWGDIEGRGRRPGWVYARALIPMSALIATPDDLEQPADQPLEDICVS